VEVKIGVQYAARELVLESAQSPDEVVKAVSEALRADLGVLTLVDDKGRRVLVPATSSPTSRSPRASSAGGLRRHVAVRGRLASSADLR
jgi:hypothetical protein